MKRSPRNFFYFFNGSIGDILMAIFLFDNIHLNDSRIKIHAVVPRNFKLFKELTKGKDYFKIVLANKRSIRGIINSFFLLRHCFSKNNILVAPTQNILPLDIKIFSRMLSLNARSVLVGFKDKGPNKNFFSKTIELDSKILYYELLKKALFEFGFEIKIGKPMLPSKRENQNYIVVHPFGATSGRSILGEDLKWLIDRISEKFSGEVIITGSSKDEPEAKKNISGKIKCAIGLPINELCNLIDSARYFIGVDTGPTHIASLLGKKSLVLAKNGTPNWLPYYNDNARILYKVDGCQHGIYEGRDHLEKCRGDRLRCLVDIPRDVILEKLNSFLI